MSYEKEIQIVGNVELYMVDLGRLLSSYIEYSQLVSTQINLIFHLEYKFGLFVPQIFATAGDKGLT